MGVNIVDRLVDDAFGLLFLFILIDGLFELDFHDGDFFFVDDGGDYFVEIVALHFLGYVF
jgi:hypothetical protein